MKRKLRKGSQLSIARLRMIFIALGIGLSGGLLTVSLLVKSRLDEAKRDREEMVALRVFDELEREVSAFLDQENERDHYRNLADTNPETWAPFVVGYYVERVPSGSLELAAADGATTENKRRIRWAVQMLHERRSLGFGSVSSANEAPPIVDAEATVAYAAPPAPAPVAQEKEPVSGAKIIESLNRAPERRKQVKPSSKSQVPQDQFLDYRQAY